MRPLDGTTVVDVSQALSGPYATQIFADMGADVIKVEHPRGGDLTRLLPPEYGDVAAYYSSLNRNKRSITADVSRERGQEIVKRLVDNADVFVQNWGPGSDEKYGLDYRSLSEITSDLIYCDISAYGEGSPYADRKAFDIVFQAQSGIASVTGPEGGEPVRVGTSISDIAAAMNVTYSVITALYHRANTGKGQYIDVSLLDSSFALLMYHVANFFASGVNPDPMGRKHWNVAPYGIFEAKDGYLAFGAITPQMWKDFCVAIDREEWLEDERFGTFRSRIEHREELDAEVTAIIEQRPAETWLDIFETHDIPASPLNTIADIVEDPHIEGRELLTEQTHPDLGTFRLIENPVNFSTLENDVHSPPPALGEHTEDILTAAGYSDDEIAELRRENVI